MLIYDVNIEIIDILINYFWFLFYIYFCMVNCWYRFGVLNKDKLKWSMYMYLFINRKKKFFILFIIIYFEIKNWMFLDLVWKMDLGLKVFNEFFKKLMFLNLIRNLCFKC